MNGRGMCSPFYSDSTIGTENKLPAHERGALDDAYAERRHAMVAEQVRARGVSDKRVLEALRAVPRHCFVPYAMLEEAYEDHPVGIACDQTISQPYMVGMMTELLELQPGDRVLEVGTGSGYQAAVLSLLSAEVISIERHPDLAKAARDRLRELGYANVTVFCGDGTLGLPESAPYDAIIVTAAGPEVPLPLVGQLALHGRLVCPAGGRDLQQLIKMVSTESGIKREETIPCIFVPLLGECGWPVSLPGAE